jgi:chemotaxis protein methyltransferase WspC
MKTAVLARWVRNATGLEPEKLGLTHISSLARERFLATGCSGYGDYIALLQQCPDESTRFLDRIVVSETWFFRERAAVDEFVRHVTTTWGRKSPTQTLRVLSVPCASGEEPYSIAMALAMASWPDRRLHIDAYDLSGENIQRARNGRYRAGAFRGTDLAFRDCFFESVGAEWLLRPGLRLPVHFGVGNVMAAEFASDRAPYDAIFCRNLLIYFNAHTQRCVVDSLLHRLKPEGVLVLGSAETGLAVEFGLQALDGSRLIFPRPLAAKAPPRVHADTTPRAPSPRSLPPPAARPAARIAHLEVLARMRELADQGRIQDATHIGRVLLRQHSHSADLQCLLAILAEAEGYVTQAESHYRKALYLEPKHEEAVRHFALLLQRRGLTDAADALRRRSPSPS